MVQGEGTPAGTPKPAVSDATGAAARTGAAAGDITRLRRRLRVRVPRRLRRVRINRAGALAVARSIADWTRRPAGRLLLPGLLLLTLLALTGAAGVYLVPAATRRAAAPPAVLPAPSESGFDTGGVPVLPDGLRGDPSRAPVTGGPVGSAPPIGPTATATPGTVAGRPADSLAGWAGQVSSRVNIPVVAMQAYGYAELVLGRTTPGCKLTWTTLAAIGRVESGHGSANGAVLGADGQAHPPIIGLPLDGQGGRMRIADTEQGRTDGDRQYDRAVGPMQFIPTTWAESGADADNDGAKDPNDIDDAALAAGNYLCKGGRDLSTATDWWNAILSYNDVAIYAQDVFTAANDYGTRSRT